MESAQVGLGRKARIFTLNEARRVQGRDERPLNWPKSSTAVTSRKQWFRAGEQGEGLQDFNVYCPKFWCGLATSPALCFFEF
jgi:hypothetical protein